jgi:hypothetical protein
MRRIVVAMLLSVVLAAPVGAGAATPKRGCGTRAEGPKPATRLAGPQDVKIGPAALVGARVWGDPDELATNRDARSGRYLVKLPLAVRAGRVVTLSIAPHDRDRAGLTFGGSLGDGAPAVRFHACDKREPSFAHDGTVGPVTFFAGGFSLAEPACVTVRLRLRGHAVAYSRIVSFGMGTAPTSCRPLP